MPAIDDTPTAIYACQGFSTEPRAITAKVYDDIASEEHCVITVHEFHVGRGYIITPGMNDFEFNVFTASPFQG